MTQTREYAVEGMTCNHCGMSVSEEVSEVNGVESVEVDVQSGRLSVVGDDFTDENIAAAVSEAGYRLKS